MQQRKQLHEPRHTGEYVADIVATAVGSWPFIIIQALLLALWITLNSIEWAYHWDPAPFILLNLCLSFQAAFTAPIIMISQNREAAKNKRRDDLEAKEVQELFESHALLVKLNEQQLEILELLRTRGQT